MIDLWLRDRNQLLILDGFVDLLRNKRLQHFAFDVVRKAAADERNRRFARTKSGYACNAGKLASYPLDSFLHVRGGKLQIEFTPASFLGHRCPIFPSPGIESDLARAGLHATQ